MLILRVQFYSAEGYFALRWALYHFVQDLVQIADQIERQVYQAELLAFWRLYNIYRVWVRPNADGYVYIRIVHENLE